MDEEKKDDILRHFSTFKDYLGDQVEKGEKLGLSEERITKGAKRVADYLAKHVEPRNREEKLLNELWHVDIDEERQHLASTEQPRDIAQDLLFEARETTRDEGATNSFIKRLKCIHLVQMPTFY